MPEAVHSLGVDLHSVQDGSVGQKVPCPFVGPSSKPAGTLLYPLGVVSTQKSGGWVFERLFAEGVEVSGLGHGAGDGCQRGHPEVAVPFRHRDKVEVMSRLLPGSRG